MTIKGAISELNNLLKADDIPFYYKPSIKKVIETIEQDAIEQRFGYWIDNKARKDLCNCSECGALSKAYSKYCPNCGRRMIEVSEPVP